MATITVLSIRFVVFLSLVFVFVGESFAATYGYWENGFDGVHYSSMYDAANAHCSQTSRPGDIINTDQDLKIPWVYHIQCQLRGVDYIDHYSVGYVCPDPTHPIDRDPTSPTFGRCVGDNNEPTPSNDCPTDVVLQLNIDRVGLSGLLNGAPVCHTTNGVICEYKLPLPIDASSGIQTKSGMVWPVSLLPTGNECPPNPDSSNNPVGLSSGDEFDPDNLPASSENKTPVVTTTETEPPTTQHDSPAPGETTTTKTERSVTQGGAGTSVESKQDSVIITTTDGTRVVKTTTTTTTTHADGSKTVTKTVEYSQDPETTVKNTITWSNGTPSVDISVTKSPGRSGSSTITQDISANGTVSNQRNSSSGDCVDGNCNESSPNWSAPSGKFPQIGGRLYTPKFPDGLVGVWNKYADQLRNTGFIQAIEGIIPSVGGGRCPSYSISFNLGAANFGTHQLVIPCWIFETIGLIMMTSASFQAIKIVF